MHPSTLKAIVNLRSLGKKNGFVTRSEISDFLPTNVLSPMQINAIVNILKLFNINVIEANSSVENHKTTNAQIITKRSKINLNKISLKSFVKNNDIPIRIKNAIASESDYFDFGTLHDFLNNNDNYDLLRRTPNLGKGSIDQLTTFINNFVECNDIIESTTTENLEPIKEKFFIKKIDTKINESISNDQAKSLKGISIGFFANNSMDLDVRTRNCLIEAEKNKSLEHFFENLYDLYVAPSSIKNLLTNLPNFGKHSKAKLNVALKNLIEDEELLLNYETLCNEAPETLSDYESIKDLMEREIYQIDDKRALEIINFRLLKSKKSTLEEIAANFVVTRERVRQIEAKSLLKLKSSINLRFNEEQIIEWSRNKFENFFFAKNPFISLEMAIKILKEEDEPTYNNLFININSKGLEDFLNKYFLYSVPYKGWFVDNEVNEINITNEPQHNQLSFSEALQKSNWPIQLDDVAKLLNEPKSVTRDKVYLNNNNSLKKIGELELIEFKSVKVQNMFRYILRKNGAEMSLYEIQEQCKKLFKRNLTIRNTGSRLSETDGILIVERGKYNLIENLSLTENEIEMIYDFTEAFLLNQQKFISSKIICKEIYLNSLIDSEMLNGYSLLGLLKSDRNNRFKCERGLMIGLNNDEFSAKKVDQLDEVIQLIEDKGSLSIGQIVFHLSQHREILNMTIEKILRGNNDIFHKTHGNKWNLTNENTSSDGVIDNSPKLDELIRIAKERKIQKSINS